MNLRDIEYILAAAETGNFARAAELCNVSQPSLSIQIKKVEERLGSALFVRDKKGVRLSEFGHTTITYFEDIHKNVAQINNLARKKQDIPPPRIRVGAIATAAPYILPHVMHIENLDVEESTTADLIQKILNDEIDAALLALPTKAPMLSSVKLYDEPFYLVTAEENHSADDMDYDTMEPPQGCKILALTEEHCMGEQTMSLCKLRLDDKNRIFKATSLETIRHMVATSNDMTLMPALAWRGNDGLTYHKLPKKFHRKMGLVFKSRSEKIEQIHELRDTIKALPFLSEFRPE